MHVYDVFVNLIQKSTQLSNVGEKERTNFFNLIRSKIKVSAGV